MSVRAVLAVVLAAALLGAALPGVDSARRQGTAAQVDRQLDRLATAAERLQETDDLPPTGPMPRRTLTLRLPRGTWAQAAATVRLPPDARRVYWETGGETHSRRLPTGVRGPPAGLRLGPGRHRLVLVAAPDGVRLRGGL